MHWIHFYIIIYCKTDCLYLPIFYLVCGLIHLKCLKSNNDCSSFLRNNPCIFDINISNIYKNLNLLLYLLINYLSAPQILSRKGECTCIFSNFLLIDLCKSFVNFLLEIICGLLQLYPGARREDLSSQLFLTAVWLLVTCVCPVCLVDEFSPCVLWPLIIELMLVLLTFFWMVIMVLLLWRVDAILGNGYGI